MATRSKTTQKSKTVQSAKILYKQLNSNDEKIIKVLQEKLEAYTTDLATEIGINLSTINRRTKFLQDEGLVVKYKKDKKMVVKWVGGTPAIEQELLSATNKHISASLLAENYDSIILNPFSIFALLFEENYWEVIMNLKEGRTDVELGQYVGNSINLDSIRRIIVTCESHNILKINRIRDPAINDVIKLYEPLYRIETVNRDYLEYLIIIRGLASSMSIRMEGKLSKGYSHLYDSLLDMVVPMFLSLRDKATSNIKESDNEILKNVILNYDFAPDLDRIYRNENWRKLLNQSDNIQIDEKSDHIMINKILSENYKKALLGRVLKN